MRDVRMSAQETKASIMRSMRKLLLGQGSGTKAELSEKLQISFPTISKFLTLMERSGEVSLAGLDESSGGRRAKRYVYNANYRLGLAIFLEKHETHYTIFNGFGDQMGQGRTNSVLQEEASSLVNLIRDIMDSYPSIQSVAIGVPGAVNEGKIFYMPAYEQYDNLHLKQYIEEQIGVPAVVENDMNAAVLGYIARRKLQEMASIIYLYLGQNGPGAGVAVNGQIVRGKSFFSGEVSFIPQYDYKNFLQALNDERDADAAVKHIDPISRLVAAITAILNPDYFVFCEEEVNSHLISEIIAHSAAYVPKEHLPELSASDWKSDYLYGLQSLGLNALLIQTN
ncbi:MULTISPECIES: ROK family transcriptional regulator [unclassified Paenibacillus]|uniref:ROK family transcriptional regulator n=1 Tax=unclassified Paenibacillus TaxID=185978 RepID=UPI002F3F761E